MMQWGHTNKRLLQHLKRRIRISQTPYMYVPNQLGAILHGAKQDNVKGCRGLGSRKRRMDDRRFCNGITMGAVKGYCKNWTVVFD